MAKASWPAKEMWVTVPTCALSLSGYGINSTRSMQILRSFAIIRASATGGAMSANSRAGPALSRFGHSFSLKLSLLAIVLLTVPVALYWQFRRYEHEQAVVLRNALEQTSRLITAILRPHLANFPSEGPQDLRNALASAAVAGISVKILLRPAADGGQNFFYIISSPPVSLAYLRQEQRALVQSGIFRNLMPTCNRFSDLSVRFINPAGKPEMLTSMTPVHTGNK